MAGCDLDQINHVQDKQHFTVGKHARSAKPAHSHQLFSQPAADDFLFTDQLVDGQSQPSIGGRHNDH